MPGNHSNLQSEPIAIDLANRDFPLHFPFHSIPRSIDVTLSDSAQRTLDWRVCVLWGDWKMEGGMCHKVKLS